MIILTDKQGSLSNLGKMLREAEADTTVKAIMVLACEANNFTPENSDVLFRNVNKPIFGGIFPQILYNTENLLTGTIVAGLTHKVSPFVIENISKQSAGFDKLLEDTIQVRPKENETIFLFVDGISSDVSSLLDSAFNHFGLISNYIGGGAGSVNFTPMPCVITAKGLLQDAALFAFAEIRSGIGVAHGWLPVSQPLKVTESDYNTVVSLDWKPAFEVYREIIAHVTKTNLQDVSFAGFAKNFPLGIAKMADELLVRDPVECLGNSMRCLGELPEKSFIYVLHGDTNSLLAGAKKSRSIAGEAYYSQHKKRNEVKPVVFIIDCIARAQFLGADFKEELKIASFGNELIGALSLGEIANSGRDYLEFYNKTSVIALLED